ncbi:MAG: hypothetical protein ACJAYG_002754 [Oceanicoccus sp.]|jgi:hypothetical protein
MVGFVSWSGSLAVAESSVAKISVTYLGGRKDG